MEKAQNIVMIGIFLAFSMIAFFMYQFPEQTAQVEELRKSMLKQVSAYLPEQPERRSRRRG